MSKRVTSTWYNFWQTTLHKWNVFKYMVKYDWSLWARALLHDLSKYSKHEAPYFAHTIFRLKHATYGSPEYTELLKKIEPAIKHHYSVNRHHPEHFKNGIVGMNETDKVEMIADWLAAVKRVKNGDIYKSLEINQKRFGYTDEDKEFFLSIVKKLEGDIRSITAATRAAACSTEKREH